MKTSKHNHKGTNKLKVCLLSLFLLMPFICFIPTAFYYGFNEQAQAQTKTIETLEYYNTSSNDEFYEIEDLDNETVYSSFYFDVGDDNTDIFPIEYCMPTGIVEWYEITTYSGCGLQTDSEGNLYLYNNGIKYDLLGGDYSYSFIFVIGNYRQQFVEFFVGNNFVKNEEFIGSDILVAKSDLVSETYTMSITDSMSTAWTNTWSNPLFSWVNNNPLKNNIDGFVNWFGITDSAVIPQYLTYIVSIVGIYIVIDIILVLFTHLTHMFSKEQS